MKLVKTIASLGAAAFLCGYPTTHAQHLPQPRRLAIQGAYVHTASRIVMPETVAGFQRVNVQQYDAGGFDVSAGYNLAAPSRHITGTVYVYPAPRLTSIGSPPDVVAEARAHLTKTEFERRKQEIQHEHPGAAVFEERDATHTENGQTYPGKLAVYVYDDAFGGSRIPVRSELYVFCFVGGKWAIEYRFTHPQVEDANKEIQEFIQGWHWYGKST